MEQSSSAGPVQIVSITEDHKFVLDEKKLKQILFHKRAIGKKVGEKTSFFFHEKTMVVILVDFTCVDCW
jgi:hypothetical protein